MARIVTVFLTLVALAQLLRLILQVEVVAGGVLIPLWASAIACLVTGGLAIRLKLISCVRQNPVGRLYGEDQLGEL